jgi:hypothetical protein
VEATVFGHNGYVGHERANANYNAFQLSVSQRASHGLTLNINYTYSHNIDDAGTQRSGYDIPVHMLPVVRTIRRIASTAPTASTASRRA